MEQSFKEELTREQIKSLLPFKARENVTRRLLPNVLEKKEKGKPSQVGDTFSLEVSKNIPEEIAWSEFDKYVNPLQEKGSLDPEEILDRQIRASFLYYLGFVIAPIPPYPVTEPNWRRIQDNKTIITYLSSGKEGYEAVYLVRFLRRRKDYAFLEERVVYSPSETALEDYLGVGKLKKVA